MKILAVSVNHRTAPVEVREAVHLNEEEVKALIPKAANILLKEGVIISTCNRTELIGIPADSSPAEEKLKTFIKDFKKADAVSEDHFETFTSFDALKHLFSLSAGIDSMLIGDNQIFKQVKDSFQISEENNFTGFLMKRVFDAAIRTGKRAISETKISDGAVTVSFAAVQLTEKIFSNLSKKSALLIGAGETGEIAAKHLHDKNIGSITVTNRTLEKAEKLSAKLDGKVIPFSEYKNELHNFDIIICATSSPDLLLREEDFKTALKKRSRQSMVVMDIAVPRDVDPAVKKLDYVFYHDIDSLNIIVEQNLTKRKNEIPKVEKIIDEELNNFIEWYNSLQAAPTIKELTTLFESIRAEETVKNKNRFSDDDREKLEIVTKRIVNKILHYPIIQLRKTDEDTAKIGIIRELFGLDKKEGNNK